MISLYHSSFDIISDPFQHDFSKFTEFFNNLVDATHAVSRLLMQCRG